MLITDHQSGHHLIHNWNEGIRTINTTDASIGGDVYTSYSIGTPQPAEEMQTETSDRGYAMQLWAGRVVALPLALDELFAVDSSWLMSESNYFDRTQNMDTREAFGSVGPFIYSNTAACVAIHEKVHGGQDWRLPLPILEAAAHYYEKQTAKRSSWNGREMADSMEALAEFYGSCVDELGEDVHRLLFGNLNQQRRVEVLAALKMRFTAERIEELAKIGRTDQHVYWNKIAASEIEEAA